MDNRSTKIICAIWFINFSVLVFSPLLHFCVCRHSPLPPQPKGVRRRANWACSFRAQGRVTSLWAPWREGERRRRRRTYLTSVPSSSLFWYPVRKACSKGTWAWDKVILELGKFELQVTTYMIGFPKNGMVSFWAINSCKDNKILWRIKIRGHMCAKSTHVFININSPSVAPFAWSRRRNCRFGSSPISANRKGSQFHFIFRNFFSQIDQPHEKRIPVTPRSLFSVVWKKRRRRRRPTESRPTVFPFLSPALLLLFAPAREGSK